MQKTQSLLIVKLLICILISTTSSNWVLIEEENSFYCSEKTEWKLTPFKPTLADFVIKEIKTTDKMRVFRAYLKFDKPTWLLKKDGQWGNFATFFWGHSQMVPIGDLTINDITTKDYSPSSFLTQVMKDTYFNSSAFNNQIYREVYLTEYIYKVQPHRLQQLYFSNLDIMGKIKKKKPEVFQLVEEEVMPFAEFVRVEENAQGLMAQIVGDLFDVGLLHRQMPTLEENKENVEPSLFDQYVSAFEAIKESYTNGFAAKMMEPKQGLNLTAASFKQFLTKFLFEESTINMLLWFLPYETILEKKYLIISLRTKDPKMLARLVKYFKHLLIVGLYMRIKKNYLVGDVNAEIEGLAEPFTKFIKGQQDLETQLTFRGASYFLYINSLLYARDIPAELYYHLNNINEIEDILKDYILFTLSKTGFKENILQNKREIQDSDIYSIKKLFDYSYSTKKTSFEPYEKIKLIKNEDRRNLILL